MEPFAGTPVEASGLLFIGDLHLSSSPPGRRRQGYMGQGLAKLRHLIDLANEMRFAPIMLGDVFDRERDPSEALKTRLLRELHRSWTTVLTNVGNHDKQGAVLSESDSLAVVSETGHPLRAFASSGPGAEFLIEGRRVGVGFTPHDQPVPEDVRGAFPGADAVFWITHHDIGFEGAYPGALEPHPIEGCNVVVNGHMHLRKQPVTAGGTMWCNFGSIGRTAIDAVNHEPSGWSFRPSAGLVRHPVPFERDVFNLTGRLVAAASPGEGAASAGSAFLDMLAAGRAAAAPAFSSDGTILLEALVSRLEAAGAGQEVLAMALDLHRRAVARRSGERRPAPG